MQQNSYQINLWRQRKILKVLDAATGCHTSLITLLIPPGSQMGKVSHLLTTEYGTASSIKSRVTRQNVLDALKMLQAKIKLLSNLPSNGVALFAGNIQTGESDKMRRLMIVLEPIQPINIFLYRCDSRFQTEVLKKQLTNDESYGVVVIDGSGTLFATIQGNTQNILHYYQVDLPRKHHKGGQSSVRFARLRLEARHNYLMKVVELTSKFFIDSQTNKLNVKGLIIAGSADFKDQLVSQKILDPRIQAGIITVVDVAYGNEQGLNQAITLSAESLQNVSLVEQKKLFARFFDEVALGNGKICYGIESTMVALEGGVIEKLLVWENLPLIRYSLHHKSSDDMKYRVLKEDQPPPTENDYEVVDSEPLVDFLAEHYTEFGTELHFVSDTTSEGAMFMKGFGGIGGILRYPMPMENEEEEKEEEDTDPWTDGLL